MFLNVAFYKFVELQDLAELRQKLLLKLLELELKGTILVSSEGINGCLSGAPERVLDFRSYLSKYPAFKDLVFKESYSERVAFPRTLVKIKKEIIPMGIPGIKPLEATGPRLDPSELKRWLDEGRELVLMDTRNEYETGLGSFKNALDLGLKTFRQFPERLAEQLEKDPSLRDKPVVMFCTGGIRCEKATAYAISTGMTNVYQLDGGILKYFEKCGPEHYEGECFVFDRRVAVDPELKPSRALQCHHCRTPFLPENGHECPKHLEAAESQLSHV